LHIEFRNVAVAETKDYDENISINIDPSCNAGGVTIEHAQERTDILLFSYEQGRLIKVLLK
jgi:uncharacterized protein YuzE